MKEYPLITKKEVRSNKALKRNQKEYHKQHRNVKGRFPKARISKMIRLLESSAFLDLTGKSYDKKEPLMVTREDLLETVCRSDIRGLGGSGFPTYRKLLAVLNSNAKDKYLIINGVECDPGLLHDAWLLKNRAAELNEGIRLLQDAVPFSRVILATKDALSAAGKAYEVQVVPDRYPMGAEKLLAEHLLGLKFQSKEIPAEKGILVINVQTLLTIYEAVCLGRPADSRYLTMADLVSGEAVVIRAQYGTPVIDIAGKLTDIASKSTIYFGGGILSGQKASKEDKLTAKTNFISFGKAVSYDKDAKCRKCGACARSCPMKIKVNKIVQAEEKGFTEVSEYRPELCIKCGTCTYLCAAGKNTMEIVSAAGEGSL